MKLFISKVLSTILSIIGVACIFVFTFMGDIMYGWVLFVILSFVSGMISTIFFRCPHCGKAIPANMTLNQKYCPLCGEDIGMKPSRFSYYGKCHRDRNGTLRGYTLVGPMVFIVCMIILSLIVVAVFGVESMSKTTGRLALLLAFIISIVLAIFCRVVVSSAVKLDREAIYYSKLPFCWRRYEISDIADKAKLIEPFYHVNKGYVFAAKEGLIAIPMASYAGGQMIFEEFTRRIGCDMPAVRPDLVMSKRSEQARADEEKYVAAARTYEEKFGGDTSK